MTRTTIVHLRVLDAKVERKEPSWQPFGSDTKNLLSRYRDLLDALGLDDPSDSGIGHPRRAVDLLDHAISLCASSRAITRPASNPDDDAAKKLATGELDRSALAKHLGKTPTAKELQEMRKRDQQVLAAAGLSAFRIGCRAIRDVGEERWLGILTPIAEKAIRTKDQQRWTGAHELAAYLRQPDIAALSRAACGRTELPRMYYMFGRPDEVYRWQVERATHTHEMSNEHAGEFSLVTIGFSINYRPPFPTLRDIDLSWEPGLYSASDAVANLDAIRVRQNAEIDAAAPAEEPQPRRAAFLR